MDSFRRFRHRTSALVGAWFSSRKKLASKISHLTLELDHKRLALIEEQNMLAKATYANQSLSDETRNLKLELITARDEIDVLRARVDLMTLAYGQNRQLVIQAITTAGGIQGDHQNADRETHRLAHQRQSSG